MNIDDAEVNEAEMAVYRRAYSVLPGIVGNIESAAFAVNAVRHLRRYMAKHPDGYLTRQVAKHEVPPPVPTRDVVSEIVEWLTALKGRTVNGRIDDYVRGTPILDFAIAEIRSRWGTPEKGGGGDAVLERKP